MRQGQWGWRWGLGGVLALTLLTAGCGSVKRGDVSGKVSLQGKPLVYGFVTIVGEDGVPLSGSIQSNGTYTVSGVPAGPARIAVTSDLPTPVPSKKMREGTKLPPKGPGALDPSKAGPTKDAPPDGWFKIPSKYGNVITSELTLTVQPGATSLDIDLPDLPEGTEK